MRAITSVALPAVSGTTICTGLSGQLLLSCAAVALTMRPNASAMPPALMYFMGRSSRVPLRPSMAAPLQARREQIPAARQALELMRAAVGELQPGARHEVGHHPRDQDLARLGLRHDSRRRVHGDPTDVAATHLDLA